ncbi:hypothetical protein ACLOJK_029834 [Asimina triloba]
MKKASPTSHRGFGTWEGEEGAWAAPHSAFSSNLTFPTRGKACHKSVYGRPQPLHVPNSPRLSPPLFLPLFKNPTFFSSTPLPPIFSSLHLLLHHHSPPLSSSSSSSSSHSQIPTASSFSSPPKMCSSAKANNTSSCHAAVAQIDGRPVLQPACNRNAVAESKQNPKKKCPSKGLPLNTTTATNAANIAKASKLLSPPISPKYKDPNGLNSSSEKPATPRANAPKPVVLQRKNSKKCSSGVGGGDVGDVSYESLWNSASVVAAGSIAVARKEQMSLMQAQRKMRIAHYGRTPAKLEAKAAQADSSLKASAAAPEEKRCSFITPNSDPLYIAYHDEEWGVPVHNDQAAFAGFDVETVANFTEKQIVLISADCGLDLNKVRGVVDNANRILQIKKERGSFNKYLWDFVNNKPISTQYKSCRKIPVKTSKSETISKDMVRRGFRFVGPTVVHSFMQAAGLTNGHLISCPRHLQCIALASHHPTVAPAL